MTALVDAHDLIQWNHDLDAERPFPGAVHRTEFTPEAIRALAPEQVNATMLAHSVNAQGDVMCTLAVGMPRNVLAEYNTHHQVYRNSASTRAIPLAKQLRRVLEAPYIPWVMSINRSGMAADWYALPGSEVYEDLKAKWMVGAERAVDTAMDLSDGDFPLHKQQAGRVLEPYLYNPIITSGTSWANFMRLRVARDAQPEIQAVAVAIRDAMAASTPQFLEPGEWHLPLIGMHPDDDNLSLAEKLAVSSGRLARTSYVTHDGVRDVDADIALGKTLWSPGHASPFEHPATPIAPNTAEQNEIELRHGDTGVNFQRRYALTGFANLRFMLDRHQAPIEVAQLLGAL